MSPKRKKNGQGMLLECWRPPRDAGSPIGCLATTYTFDPEFYEEECLARYLELQSDYDREGLAYILEREERLGGLYAGVLVDWTNAAVDHALSWDILPVRVRSAFQHAKVTILAWENYLRIIVASANLTEPGYRSNYEVAGTLQFSPDEADHTLIEQVCSFLEEQLLYVPGGHLEEPGVLRARAFIGDLRDRTSDWKATNQRKQWLEVHLAFTAPRPTGAAAEVVTRQGPSSALGQYSDICRRSGSAPTHGRVVSPFFDKTSEAQAYAPIMALCKVMNQRETKELTICVPRVRGEHDEPPMLTAPKVLYDTAVAEFGEDVVGIEALPDEDVEHYARPWHAKLISLGSSKYRSLMIGSSNFTRNGLGLRNASNFEANLVYVVRKKNYRRDAGGLDSCWPETEYVEHLDSFQWTDEAPLNNENPSDDIQHLAIPGFLAATYRGSAPPAVVLLIDSEHLPEHWSILTAGARTVLVADSESTVVPANATRLTIPWEEPDTPERLIIRWDTHEASLPVNVEDRRYLPPPEELANLGFNELLAILSSRSPASVLRALAKTRGHGRSEEDGVDTAAPVDLNPLQRYDLRKTFLRRIRLHARQLAAVRDSLGQPVSTPEALDWRLNGYLGIRRLAGCMVAELKAEPAKASEKILVLCDLLLMLSEVDYEEREGALSCADFETRYRAFLADLIDELAIHVKEYSTPLSPAIRDFWKRVTSRCLES